MVIPQTLDAEQHDLALQQERTAPALQNQKILNSDSKKAGKRK